MASTAEGSLARDFDHGDLLGNSDDAEHGQEQAVHHEQVPSPRLRSTQPGQQSSRSSWRKSAISMRSQCSLSPVQLLVVPQTDWIESQQASADQIRSLGLSSQVEASTSNPDLVASSQREATLPAVASDSPNEVRLLIAALRDLPASLVCSPVSSPNLRRKVLALSRASGPPCSVDTVSSFVMRFKSLQLDSLSLSSSSTDSSSGGSEDESSRKSVAVEEETSKRLSADSMLASLPPQTRASLVGEDSSLPPDEQVVAAACNGSVVYNVKRMEAIAAQYQVEKCEELDGEAAFNAAILEQVDDNIAVGPANLTESTDNNTGTSTLEVAAEAMTTSSCEGMCEDIDREADLSKDMAACSGTCELGDAFEGMRSREDSGVDLVFCETCQRRTRRPRANTDHSQSTTRLGEERVSTSWIHRPKSAGSSQLRRNSSSGRSSLQSLRSVFALSRHPSSASETSNYGSLSESPSLSYLTSRAGSFSVECPVCHQTSQDVERQVEDGSQEKQSLEDRSDTKQPSADSALSESVSPGKKKKRGFPVKLAFPQRFKNKGKASAIKKGQ